MDKMKLIVAIADRGSGDKMARTLAEAGCRMNLQLAGRGTANAPWVECLGLCDTHKDVVLSLCPAAGAKAALEMLEKQMAGKRHYLAATVPLNSIAGRAEGEEQHG
ncbi:MAG: hypothetical protein BWY81_00928 [Firmicutes bacterium ADurb.Bin467]|jgi:hypothetical protein|nr:MAG: hypothetical protein BWY81_00928 [Firmicutes bacterium ADurb.Bin467]